MPSLFELIEDPQNLRRFLSRFGLISMNYKNERIKKYNFEELSDRELQIVKLVAKGLRNKEIAEQLFISISTVKTHLSNIFCKLEVSNRTSMLTKINQVNINS
jgi:DNA-binding NarL/FixJ family response regulator